MRSAAYAFGVIAVVAAATRCASDPPKPPPCDPISKVDDKLGQLDVVWGVADLHAHPAIERAFGQRLIWGTAMDDAPVNASQLPMIAACPVETHDAQNTSPIGRAVGAEVFPELAGATGFAHAPVGGSSSAWPDARDVIHQQMNVSSIRRAYEGGLRLMFASTTDSQVFGALLAGPNVVNGFVPDPHADYVSARAQLDMIISMAAANSSWMGIARSPDEARTMIGKEGRLALVLSLEMDGLLESDLDQLLADYPIAHVVPIHLVDNDVGGTAANGSIFNSASAELSSLYRRDHQHLGFMDLSATPFYGRTMDWPWQIATLEGVPLYAEPQAIPFSQYSPRYCYDSVAACDVSAPTSVSYVQFGQENARGLCSVLDDCALPLPPGAARIQRLMSKHVMVDLSHMGRRSVAQTFDVDQSFPFVASHGDIARLCEGTNEPCTDLTTWRPGTERSLEASFARTLVQNRGVIGFGTGTAGFPGRSVFAARGGPLWTFAPAQSTACVAQPDSNASTNGCQVSPLPPASTSAQISTLEVSTHGGVTNHDANGQPYARVEMRAQVDDARRVQRRVFLAPLSCSTDACSVSIRLDTKDAAAPDPSSDPRAPQDISCGVRTCQDAQTCGSAPYTVDDVESVSLEGLFLAGSDQQCQSSWSDASAPMWTVDSVSVTANGASVPVAQLGPRASGPIATLINERGNVTVYDRDDAPSSEPNVKSSGNLLRVTMTTGPSSPLAGASISGHGSNVCFAFREWRNGTCASVATPLAPDATECPRDGVWWNLNQRGEWAKGTSLSTFARHTGDVSAICGLDVTIADYTSGGAFDVDEVRVEEVEDPVGYWIRRYAEVAKNVAHGALGALALGTDFNGLNGLIDISEFAMPQDATMPAKCPVTGSNPSLALTPMRFRKPDGSLGDQVLIEQRGLATYGLLADMFAIVREYPDCGQDVYDSLMLSAERTLRMWEWITNRDAAAVREQTIPLPTAAFACSTVKGAR